MNPMTSVLIFLSKSWTADTIIDFLDPWEPRPKLLGELDTTGFALTVTKQADTPRNPSGFLVGVMAPPIFPANLPGNLKFPGGSRNPNSRDAPWCPRQQGLVPLPQDGGHPRQPRVIGEAEDGALVVMHNMWA